MTNELDLLVEKNRVFLNDFFSFSLPFTVKSFSSRSSFDDKVQTLTGKKQQSLSWVVGRTVGNSILVLEKNVFEKESNHKAEDFEMVLRHEIAHVYLHTFFVNNNILIWFDEAFAHFIANLENKEYWKLVTSKEIPNLPKIIYPDQLKEPFESYVIGSKFLSWLFIKFGKNNILKFLLILKQEAKKTAFDIFKEVYSKEMDELFSEWKNEISLCRNKNE